MPVNSKAKGDTYERKIAKKLTEWTGLKFERVPASGGLHWKKDNRVYGDIVTNDPDFPFTIECKARESWNMDSLINGSKEVEKWWKQAIADAWATGKEPMVIFTRNRQPDYIMFRGKANLYDYISSVFDENISFRMIFKINGEELMVMKLDDAIKYCSIEVR